MYLKLQLRGEANGAEHAQGVVGESDVGVERRAYYPGLKVGDASEAVDEFAESCSVDTHRNGIDGEVAAGYIVVESAVLNNGIARIGAV